MSHVYCAMIDDSVCYDMALFVRLYGYIEIVYCRIHAAAAIMLLLDLDYRLSACRLCMRNMMNYLYLYDVGLIVRQLISTNIHSSLRYPYLSHMIYRNLLLILYPCQLLLPRSHQAYNSNNNNRYILISYQISYQQVIMWM